MDDVAWLLSQEVFGGYKFDSFERYDMQACAAVVRSIMNNDNFANTLVDCVIAAGERLKAIINDDRTTNGSFLAPKRIGPYVKLTFWNGPHELARMVEDLVLSGLRAREQFNAMPKRSPSDHRNHYTTIANLAEKLAMQLDGEPHFNELPQLDGSLPNILREVASLANERADDPPLSRPNAKHAAKTYVAKHISSWFYQSTGSFRHEAAATLMNVLFPDRETVDGGYMQSIARS